jgi:hypothetical protein
MNRECSKHGGREECILNFGEKARRRETTRKTYNVGEWIILR